MENVKSYCIRCKQSQEIKNPQDGAFKNGTPIATGECMVCGTKLFKIKKRQIKT